MGIVRTMGKFCYVECDDQNCTKKMENNDEELLKQLAKLCDWENMGTKWICPDCSEKRKTTKSRTASRRTKKGPVEKQL